MIDAFYRNPGPTLEAIFLFGIATGLLLAVWMIYLYWMIGRHTARRSSAIQEQAVLNALEVAPIEIDDDKMLCAACWEERHPGHLWGFQRRTLCIEHLISEGKPVPPTQEAENQRYALQH